VLPGGGFGNLASDIVIAEGQGARVRDVSGNEYVDFLLGSGLMFIGHAHPDVVAAVQAQILKGTTFFANSEPGIRLAAPSSMRSPVPNRCGSLPPGPRPMSTPCDSRAPFAAATKS
jgi:glutamate-1-semialdehyde aminotransferase